MMKTTYLSLLSLVFAFGLSASPVHASVEAEIMSVRGSATIDSSGVSRSLAEGDLVKIGDAIDVPVGSSVDIAYDKGWKNVTRLTGPTKITVLSIHPTGLAMQNGDVFAQLKKLPKNSTFEIQTPTGIAAVRGSALRTTHDDSGTKVFNFADSPVEVFKIDEDGKIAGEAEVLQNSEKSTVGEDGPPTPAEPMTDEEKNAGSDMQSGLQEEIKDAVEEGRESLLPDIETIEKEYTTALEERMAEYKDPDQSGGTSETDSKTLQEDMQKTEAILPDLDKILDQTENSVEQIQQSQEFQNEKTFEEKKQEEETTTAGTGGTYVGGGP